MSKHTPGPWFAMPATEEMHEGIYDSYGAYIHLGDPANARLIAAAPGLLAALEASCVVLKYGASSQEEIAAIVRVAEAAIAKATGGDA